MQIGTPAYVSSEAQRWRVVRAMLALNVVALVAAYLSGHWDAAEHAKGAVDRFWYPPHFGIYFSILAAALLSLIGLIVLLRERGLPFETLRHNAALTLIVVANGVSFTGAPFDAWWHNTFGIDLTVWSPPHLHLLIGMVLAALGCAVYFLDGAPVKAPLQPLRLECDGRYALTVLTMLVALLLASFLFVEYEGGIHSRDVLARPSWSYPLLWSFFVCFSFTLWTAATRRIGTATFVATLYVLARLAVLGFDRAVLDFRGFALYPLVVPALVFDLGLALLWPRWGKRWPWLPRVVTGLLVASTVALTTPLWWSLLQVAPELNVRPWQTAWPPAIIVGVLGTIMGWWCGRLLRRLRPSEQIISHISSADI